MAVSNHARLLDHVLVLSGLMPQRIHHPESLTPVGKQPGDDLHARRYVDVGGAAHHLGGELFMEVPHACACGHALDREPNAALERWLEHASGQSGFKAAFLGDHVVVRIAGTPSTVTCLCGRTFSAPPDNPSMPSLALEGWLAHLEERA